MKIALLEPLNVSEEMLREMAAPVLERGHELTVYDTKADSPQEVIRRAQGMDAVIIANTPFPAEAVTENPALKYIDVAFTGVDHVPMEAWPRTRRAGEQRGQLFQSKRGRADGGHGHCTAAQAA